MRVKPTAAAGIGVWLLYAVIVVAFQKTSGIPYTDFGDSVVNMWRAVIPSLALGAVVITVLGVWMGWWAAALRDRYRTIVTWALIAPAIYFVVSLANLATTDWGRVSVGFLVVALVSGLLVGFAEEFLCRGLLLVGLRGTYHEVVAWALTCVLFGLMHGLNMFMGAAVGGTVFQMVMAGIQGSAFYILRRRFGTLIWAMALHGLWDMSIFVHDASGAEPTLLGSLVWVTAPIALAGGFVTARRTQHGSVEGYAVGTQRTTEVSA